MPSFRTLVVDRVILERDGLQRVVLDDGSAAYALTDVIGRVAPGDRVVVNTTAVDLGLGTGGAHVVHWNLTRPDWSGQRSGHVMKLRYTSAQVDIDAGEEAVDDHGEPPDALPHLGGLPVVVASLHSQVAAVAAAYKLLAPGRRLVYVMTDGGALPLALSDLVADLRRHGLLDATVTAGHAFGGDREAVNVPSALHLAMTLEGADAVVVAMGPGGVGTGSGLGATALEVGPILDAVATLGGHPIAALRFSLADTRPRHQGVSHHTRTALSLAAHPATLAVPEGPYAERVVDDLTGAGLDRRHRLAVVATPDVETLFADLGLAVTSMGRTPHDDPGFFVVAAAAGVVGAAGCSSRQGTVPV